MARMTPPKSPMVCEKYQTGCMWRLYGFFDFRPGHSNKKLLSDKRHSNRFDKRNSKTKLELLNNSDEKCQSMCDKMKNKTQTVDSDMASKSKHKGEELSTEVPVNKNIASEEVKHLQSNSKVAGQLPKKNRKARKTLQTSLPISLHGLKTEAKNRVPSSSVSVEKSLNKLNSAALADDVHVKKQRGCGCKSINCEITIPQVQMNAAEGIINQKFIDGKYIRRDGVNQQSKQLSDAIEIFNSNKELFIKLLQDPNTVLAKHIEDLRESQARQHQSKSLSAVCQCDSPAGIHKTKSCDINSSEESDGSQFSDRIVVLKPGPTGMQDSEHSINDCSSLQSSYSLRNNGQSEMPANFSFSQIKKKLRHAIGVSRKETLSKSMVGTLYSSPCEDSKEDCKGKGVEIIRRSSPSGVMIKSSLDVKKRVKKRDNIGKVREYESSIGREAASTSGSGLGNLNISVVRHPRRKESENSVEARNQLLELLNSGNKDKNHEKQEQKTLERMISFPEYDFLPTRSPVRDWENRLVNEQMRFSPYRNCQLLYENKWRLQKEKTSCSSPTENKDSMHRGVTNNLEVPSESESACRNDTVETNDNVHPGETNSSEGLRTADCMKKTNTTETNDTIYQGESDPVEILPELNCKDKALDWSPDKTNMYQEDEYFKSSRQLTFQEQPSTSSPDFFESPPRMQRAEDSASTEDKGEHPSPVSVLEQFFVDVISEPAEKHHSAPLVRFTMDPEISSTSSLNEHGLIAEYVRAVLQAASLNWEEISMMCDSSDQLLDPFLFDTIKLQTNQFHGDCMLLFDCIDEVLANVYHSDLRYCPWVSFIKPNVRQLPIEKTVIHKVMEYVDWHLLPHSSPGTLQQHIEMDIARSGTWIDLRKDAEVVVFQMVEDVLEELIIETII